MHRSLDGQLSSRWPLKSVEQELFVSYFCYEFFLLTIQALFDRKTGVCLEVDDNVVGVFVQSDMGWLTRGGKGQLMAAEHPPPRKATEAVTPCG